MNRVVKNYNHCKHDIRVWTAFLTGIFLVIQYTLWGGHYLHHFVNLPWGAVAAISFVVFIVALFIWFCGIAAIGLVNSAQSLEDS
jgi:hypothetical protein